MSGSRRRLRPEDRRALILTAAAEVFAAAGYDRASMRAVATEAGVTTPVLYDHFASKAELYAALVTAQADDLMSRWGQVRATKTEDVFRQTIDAIYAWIEANPAGWRMIFLDAPSDPAVAEAHRLRQEAATEVLAQQFGRVNHLWLSIDLDRKRADRFLAEAAKWAVNAIAAWWWDNRDIDRAQLVELTADLLWRGLDRITKD